MTVRFDEDQQKALEEIAEAMTWSRVKSKALRLAVTFTNECLKQIPKLKNVSHYDVVDKLNKKFKTNLDNYGYW